MDVIAIHAGQQPDKPAILEGDRSVTWGELLRRRNRLAHSLVKLDLSRGQHVIVYSLNSIEYLVATAAVRAVGAIPVPMNHRLVGEEVAYILDHSDAVAVFVDDPFLPVVEQVRPGARKVRHWILLGAERREWARNLDGLLAAGSPDPFEADPTQGLGGWMIYTAGTTGRPKGALRGPYDPTTLLERLRALDLADPTHVHLVAGPLYHAAPGSFALFTQLFGGTVVVMRKFDPEEALHTIERHRCTSTFMAPTLLKRIVDLPAEVRARYNVSSMRVIVVAAAPCPMKVKEDVTSYFGPVFYEFYGSTELGINTILRPEDVLRKPGSCGKAAPGVELAIFDDDGNPVPPGQRGELFVRRYQGVFSGYYKDPEATRQTARGDWLSVGDVAYMDDGGFFYICDRKRDMIISAGVNIYPAEIEEVLHRHPKILDVAVFGVPDEEWGERVHAAIQARPGENLTVEDVVGFARGHMAGYKVPREVSFHEHFPRDTAGKLVKRILRDPHWAGRHSGV